MKSALGRSIFVLLLLAALAPGARPQTPSSTSQNQQQDVPDAPSATRPAPSFPANTAPAAKTGDRPALPPEENPAPPQPAPPAEIKTAPKGSSAASAEGDPRDVIRVNVSLVVVPVRVKDSDGRLVEGLQKKDFAIFENGQQQPIRLFTTEPFPLSVAMVLDSDLPQQTLKKVNETLPALTGAFSDFDEVGVFSYGATVQQRLDFSGTGQPLTTVLKEASRHGRTAGPPITGGPVGGGRPNPTVNGRPFDPSVPPMAAQVAPREANVLNDAILEAALALSKRDRSRRKVIFVISDGREDGSSASYSDVLKILLQNDISVYAIGVDAAAIPVYRQLGRLRIPGFGYGNILGKYVSATGGEIFAEFTKDAIEQVYGRVTEEARNQYTLGYTTRSTVGSDYRSIDVHVHRPGLAVTAKDGYYPLPPRP